MSDVLDKILEGLEMAFLMAYEVWWALVLGFAISAIVQAWVPRERVESALSGSGFLPVAKATGLGAASSSCSYAAIAIARSLFEKGASATTALAFQFASTNLVWELGLVLWILIGWQFTLATFLGGLVMIALMALLLRVFVSLRLEERARAHARQAQAGGHCHDHGDAAEERLPWRARLSSRREWGEVGERFLADWRMLWKEISAGFLLAGFIALLGEDFFNALFVEDAPALVKAIENVIAGPLIAVLSFVCSVGNAPLAAVLWSGGISFAGVIAFIFADLIVIPIVLAYAKFYGWRFALRIVALMLVAIVAAALLVSAVFGLAGLIPTSRPSPEEVFHPIALDYKLVLNAVALAAFALLLWLARSRPKEARASQAAASPEAPASSSAARGS